MSHDLSITVDRDKGYVTEIDGLTAGDYSDQTGWIFLVNGEMGNMTAEEQILKDGDSITLGICRCRDLSMVILCLPAFSAGFYRLHFYLKFRNILFLISGIMVIDNIKFHRISIWLQILFF